VGVAEKKSNWLWRRAFVGGVVALFCVGLVLLAYWSAREHWFYGYYLLNPLCHQQPERCFEVNGMPWALCVRCVAIWCSLALGHLLFIVWRPPARVMRLGLIGAIAAMFLDVGLEFFGLYHDVETLRMLTGFLFGIFTAYFTLAGLNELFYQLTQSLFSSHE